MPIADLLRGVHEMDEHAEGFKKAEQYGTKVITEADLLDILTKHK